MVDDPRGNLVEASIQLLFILLDYTPPVDIARNMQLQQQAHTAAAGGEGGSDPSDASTSIGGEPGMGNLFCSFISRLHQNDVSFCWATAIISIPLSTCYFLWVSSKPCKKNNCKATT